MKIQVKSGDKLIDAEVNSRRILGGDLCLLVEFTKTNGQWMDHDDEHLVMTDEQRRQIQHLQWWDRKPK